MWNKFGTTVVGKTVVRFCTVPTQTDVGVIVVQVGETLNSRASFLNHVFLSILAPQVVLVSLACLSVWVGVSRGLKPLHELIAVLRARRQPDFSPVAIGRVPSELVPVIDALDDLLGTIGDQFRLQHEFIANAAHQLRTPVTAVKTYAEHMARLDITGPARSALSGLDEASNRLMNMVNRLLLLARMEAKGKYETSRADLSQAVCDATNSVIQQAIDRHIELIFDVPQGCINVQADAEDLVELVSNLLDNAIKYTPENGFVWICVRQEVDASACLIIEDSGPGIPDAHKENIFKRFFRLSGATGSGCGLGLAIAKEIVAAANATIVLSDRVGGGSSFKVAFDHVSSKTDPQTPGKAACGASRTKNP